MKRITVEIFPTPVVGEYSYQTRWDGFENDGFNVVLHFLSQAMIQVAAKWAEVSAMQAAQQAAGRIQVPGFVVTGGRD